MNLKEFMLITAAKVVNPLDIFKYCIYCIFIWKRTVFLLFAGKSEKQKAGG